MFSLRGCLFRFVSKQNKIFIAVGEVFCQYRSTCLYFVLKQTSKTHSSQEAQAEKEHIDRTSSVDRQSHNSLNKTLSFHQRHACE